MTIGQLIKKYRKEKKLSQVELGVLLGVSGSMIGQYENNLRKPKYENLQKIAIALEVPMEALFGDQAELDTIEMRAPNSYWAEYPDNSNRWKLLKAFDTLNNKGQQKAVERVEELARLPENQKDKTPPEDE